MRHGSAAVVVVGVVLGLACGGGVPVGGDAPPPAPDPIATTSWPAPSLPGVQGWLGVRAGATDGPYWTGISGATHLVVLGEAWKDVPVGTAVDAVGPSGRVAVTFAGIRTARFGCDGGTELQVGAFDGEPPGDLVWLVPPGAVVQGSAVPAVDGDGARSWRGEAGALGVRATGPHTAALWVGSEDAVLRTIDLAEVAMDGWEPEPIDLASDFFVPQVVGIWSDGATPFALATWSSFEGIHFTAITLGPAPAEVEIESLYSCAF